MKGRIIEKNKSRIHAWVSITCKPFHTEYELIEVPLLLAGDKLRNLRGCSLSGVFMPHVLIVFLLLMHTLSIIKFSRD